LPQHGDLDDHHLIPSTWGRDHGLGDLIDSILNRTPLTADTNRRIIGDRLPNAYLPKLIAVNGEQKVRKIMESHLISNAAFDILLRDPFTPEDFEAFISERQKGIQEAIEDLLIKERFDLEPRLRELDVQLEAVELSLRSLISETLRDDPKALPSHVAEKIRLRLQTAAQKNPAMDLEQYQRLGVMLEFADLRDLQDVIGNRSLWPSFEARFGSKELLNTRFGQLAELRNGIRHSRRVDEVTRKDGEAAILWFRKVLER